MLHALRWTKPGTVWAMDHSDTPCEIDGLYGKILAVTDLASRQKLLALPAASADAGTTMQALTALFLWHGAPLVLKSDNGSAFVAEGMKEFLRNHGVLQLLSPPGTPRYNGAIEAGIGSLKTRAHYESARNDRPGCWTSGDIEAARLTANAMNHPEGATGPTPTSPGRDVNPLPWPSARHFTQASVITNDSNAGTEGCCFPSPCSRNINRLPSIALQPAALSSSAVFCWSGGGDLLYRFPTDS